MTPPAMAASPDPGDLRLVDAWWRAANYLSVGQIYLYDNPLLKEPLKAEHIKPRLLGHFGTTPGLNFIYAHLYPSISQDEAGLKRLFTQFSFPGGIPSHVAPETPGSIHEGGELGYALSHAYGAAFDNPDLIVACVVGDGEAETGPLATSWHINKFLNPIRDGAVLPILNLNGYKINNPTLLARISHEELEELMRGYGWTPHFVEGSDPDTMHQAMAATIEHCIREIRAHQQKCRTSGVAQRPRWPMIVLRSPKGWSAPKEVDGHRLEGFWRAHQVPLPEVKQNPEHLRLLEEWLRSYRPQELFDEAGH